MASITLSSMRAVARPAMLRMAAPRAVSRTFSTTRLAMIKRYTRDHEWIDLSADRKRATIGVSKYAAKELGDVVYVELPVVGEVIEQGDAMGAVESVKSASDINAPIRCTITDGNAALEAKPSTINDVPEDDSNGGGWIAKVEVDEAGAKQFDDLMDAEAYKAYIAE